MDSLKSTQDTDVSDHAPQENASGLEKQEDSDIYPEGGLEAWLVVLGATVAVGCTLGYVNAFGVFESYYLNHQLSHKSASSIAWIGGLQVFFQFFTSLLAGALFDKIGARKLMIPAALSLIFSMMMTSLCHSYYQFVLAQGVLTGISLGFLFTPAFSAIQQYFFQKRGIVSGIVASGSSIGGVLYPIVLRNTLLSPTLGFGWGLRVVAFAVLGLLVMPCVLVHPRLPPRPKEMVVVLPFRQASYTFLVIGMFLMFLGTFAPIFFVTTFALDIVHMSVDMSFYMLAILNGASCFGRILTGLIADKVFGRMNTLAAVGVIVSILLFCWPNANTPAALIVWTALFGFWSGSVISLSAPCLVQIAPNPQVIGVYLGLGICVLSISGLIGSPIVGAIIGHGGFRGASLFSGATMIAGAVAVAAARWFYKKGLWAKA